MTISNPTEKTFFNLGIAPKILEILEGLKFSVPTPIQSQAIPHALAGKDIMGIAQTGTGKTLAFGIPLIQSLAKSKGVGLIILPTRELAVQVEDALNNLGRHLGMKTAVLIGGENINRQIQQLRRRPHVIIATPGRLIDHLEQKTVHLDKVSVLILDEADRMLDMGFAPQIKKILVSVPKDRQTMLFSATMPAEIINIANSYMKLPVRVEVVPQGTTATNISQELFFVHKELKMSLLESILKEYNGSALVFCRTKFGAKKVARIIRNMKFTSAEIHSNRSLNQRLEALEGFKSGKYRVLVATDIAARGIDVTGIELVINFDLPEQAADYVHRIGRTGRAQAVGHAISFATPDQKYDVRAIERLIKKQLPISTLPTLAPRVTDPGEPERERSSFSSHNRTPYRGKPNHSEGQRHPRRAFSSPSSRPGFGQRFERSARPADLGSAQGESGRRGYFISKPPRPNYHKKASGRFGGRGKSSGFGARKFSNQF